jgi:hypothetical protein
MTERTEDLPGLDLTLPGALAALRRSIEDLLEFFWEDACRNRVCEQATALAGASKLHGSIRIFALSRAIVSICFIPRDEALPIRDEIVEKLRELMGLLEEVCLDKLEEQADKGGPATGQTKTGAQRPKPHA